MSKRQCKLAVCPAQVNEREGRTDMLIASVDGELIDKSERFPGLNEVTTMRLLRNKIDCDSGSVGKYAAAVGNEEYESFLAPDGAVWGSGLDGANSVPEAIELFSTAESAMESIWWFVTMKRKSFLSIYIITDADDSIVLHEIFRLAINPIDRTYGPVLFHQSDCPVRLLNWTKDVGVFAKAMPVPSK